MKRKLSKYILAGVIGLIVGVVFFTLLFLNSQFVYDLSPSISETLRIVLSWTIGLPFMLSVYVSYPLTSCNTISCMSKVTIPLSLMVYIILGVVAYSVFGKAK